MLETTLQCARGVLSGVFFTQHFQVAGDALVTCRACLGRLWAHSCGKERGLPVNMQQQRNLRDKKRQTGIDGRAKLKTKKLLDVKVGGVSGNEEFTDEETRPRGDGGKRARKEWDCIARVSGL